MVEHCVQSRLFEHLAPDTVCSFREGPPLGCAQGHVWGNSACMLRTFSDGSVSIREHEIGFGTRSDGAEKSRRLQRSSEARGMGGRISQCDRNESSQHHDAAL